MHVLGSDRRWLLVGGVGAVLLFAVGWLLFISPQHSQTSSLQSQTDQAKVQAVALQQKLNAVRADSTNLPKYQAELATGEQALPATSGIPDFLRELQAIGTVTGVTVTAIQVAPPVAITAAAAPPATAGAPTASATALAAAPAASAANGITGPVYSVAITVTANGTLVGLSAFLQQMQQAQPRAVLIVSTKETPGQGGALPVALSASLEAFVAPGTAASAPPTTSPTTTPQN